MLTKSVRQDEGYNSACVQPGEEYYQEYVLGSSPTWIESLPIVQEDQSSSLQTLEGHLLPVRAAVFSSNGQLVASASEDRTVRQWDTATWALRSTLEGHTGSVYAVTFSPNGQLLTSTFSDGTVRLWGIATGALRSTLEDHSESVHKVIFSSDGELAASASSDSTARL